MIERAVEYKINGLIARRWDASDTLAFLRGHEKSGYYQRLELRIALLNLFIEVNKEILNLIRKVKRWKASLLNRQSKP